MYFLGICDLLSKYSRSASLVMSSFLIPGYFFFTQDWDELENCKVGLEEDSIHSTDLTLDLNLLETTGTKGSLQKKSAQKS